MTSPHTREDNIREIRKIFIQAHLKDKILFDNDLIPFISIELHVADRKAKEYVALLLNTGFISSSYWKIDKTMAYWLNTNNFDAKVMLSNLRNDSIMRYLN